MQMLQSDAPPCLTCTRSATRLGAHLHCLSGRLQGYFGYFKDERHPVSKEHGFTYDQIKDNTVFDPRNQKDGELSSLLRAARRRSTISTQRFGPKKPSMFAAKAMRKRCVVPLRTRWMVRTSQAAINTFESSYLIRGLRMVAPYRRPQERLWPWESLPSRCDGCLAHHGWRKQLLGAHCTWKLKGQRVSPSHQRF